MPLKGGTKLDVRIWFPVDTDVRPVPAVVEYLPYRKRPRMHERDARTYPYLAGSGYVRVPVDIRGRSDSERTAGRQIREAGA
ncbi:CocE/NonD family hydrolase [Reyranella soli]|uniref:CocE/NonD family hydrolase n=1 Tax=Reyranella soli TaxID=1230389 RepID=UPI0024825FF4|nr:CocE/NonD family hydrolase [Reyranella soli]